MKNQKIMETIVLESEITCPECGHKQTETMPTDACAFFTNARNCSAFLKPNAGDCCVFCNFGSVKCPPIQTNNSCAAC